MLVYEVVPIQDVWFICNKIWFYMSDLCKTILFWKRPWLILNLIEIQFAVSHWNYCSWHGALWELLTTAHATQSHCKLLQFLYTIIGCFCKYYNLRSQSDFRFLQQFTIIWSQWSTLFPSLYPYFETAFASINNFHFYGWFHYSRYVVDLSLE